MRTNSQPSTVNQKHVDTSENDSTIITEMKERITELKDRVSELKDMIATKDELIAIMREQLRMKQWQDTPSAAPDADTAAAG